MVVKKITFKPDVALGSVQLEEVEEEIRLKVLGLGGNLDTVKWNAYIKVRVEFEKDQNLLEGKGEL